MKTFMIRFCIFTMFFFRFAASADDMLGNETDVLESQTTALEKKANLLEERLKKKHAIFLEKKETEIVNNQIVPKQSISSNTIPTSTLEKEANAMEKQAMALEKKANLLDEKLKKKQAIAREKQAHLLEEKIALEKKAESNKNQHSETIAEKAEIANKQTNELIENEDDEEEFALRQKQLAERERILLEREKALIERDLELSENEEKFVQKEDDFVKNGTNALRVHARHATLRHIPPERYNGSLWVGIGFLFTPEDLHHYISSPLIDYQIGFGKSIWNVHPNDFLYTAFIFDFAQSETVTATSSVSIFSNVLYFANGQFLLGFEQTLGTRYVSAFLEAGGVFQLRSFTIQQNITSAAVDYVNSSTFGGSFNAGLNIRFYPNKNLSYLIRLGMNFMIGDAVNTRLFYNGNVINANSFTYGPSASFGIRI